ncbi:unnamed protein product [Rangifer tarandus platyrhynchus]|uniref:Uncharacterized protein n=1 Tax=Rangifer tarandus platyrhynchus TaxID=3082113 RepID=A0AC59ZV12_RANTA
MTENHSNISLTPQPAVGEPVSGPLGSWWQIFGHLGPFVGGQVRQALTPSLQREGDWGQKSEGGQNHTAVPGGVSAAVFGS